MGGEKGRKFAKRGTAEGHALIGISREKGGNIKGSGSNKLPAAKHTELAMLAMRCRAFIERRLSGGQFEVMRGAFDGADRHQDARDSRPGLGEQRPERLQRQSEHGEKGGKAVAAQKHREDSSSGRRVPWDPHFSR